MLGKLVHFASNLMVVFVAILVSMLSVDILGYYFLPPQYSEALPGYRFGDAYLTMGYYPKGYFRRDAQLGFDIEANARATTTHVDGMAYSIFSNSVGCFDERDVADFQSNNWVYSAETRSRGVSPHIKKICDSIREADGDKNGEMWRPTHGHATRVRKIQVDHSTDRFISPVIGVRRILR